MSRFLMVAVLVLGACGVEGEALEGDSAALQRVDGDRLVVVTTNLDECTGADECVLLQAGGEGTCAEVGTAPANLGEVSASCLVEDCNDCPTSCNPCICASNL